MRRRCWSTGGSGYPVRGPVPPGVRGPACAAADGREHGDLVTVGEDRRVTGSRLVAVQPHARGVQHTRELVAVPGDGLLADLADGRGVEVVLARARRVPRPGEEPQADLQRDTSTAPSRMTISPAGFTVSNP
jgi:hypothetical protein